MGVGLVLWTKAHDDGPIVRYRVPSPKAPEPKEILDKPSIKVCP